MKATPLMLLAFGAGLFFTVVGLRSGMWMGSGWYTSQATDRWGMTPYYHMDGKDAYVLCGILPLWLGGLSAGISISLLTWSKKPTLSIIPFLAALFLTALGFNTLDWMLAAVIGKAEPGWDAWTINLPIFLSPWYFYIFLVIIPLSIGGLFIGLPLVYFAFSQIE